MIVVGIRILEGMFLVGGLGCAVVLLLTTLEDIQVLFGKEDQSPVVDNSLLTVRTPTTGAKP